MRLHVSAVAARVPSLPLGAPHSRVNLRAVGFCSTRLTAVTARSSYAAGTSFLRSSLSFTPSTHSSSRCFSSASSASVESRVSSDGSHSDFSARSKPSAGTGDSDSSSDASGIISSDVSSHPVFLYMKGNPASPKCGFSANVVRILQHLGASFSSRDVLEDAAVRDAVKQYSDWPTLPQLYVRGEFVGGSDIITQMFKSGELEKMLTQAGVIQATPAAAEDSSSATPSAAPGATVGGVDSKSAQ